MATHWNKSQHDAKNQLVAEGPQRIYKDLPNITLCFFPHQLACSRSLSSLFPVAASRLASRVPPFFSPLHSLFRAPFTRRLQRTSYATLNLSPPSILLHFNCLTTTASTMVLSIKSAAQASAILAFAKLVAGHGYVQYVPPFSECLSHSYSCLSLVLLRSGNSTSVAQSTPATFLTTTRTPPLHPLVSSGPSTETVLSRTSPLAILLAMTVATRPLVPVPL